MNDFFTSLTKEEIVAVLKAWRKLDGNFRRMKDGTLLKRLMKDYLPFNKFRQLPREDWSPIIVRYLIVKGKWFYVPHDLMYTPAAVYLFIHRDQFAWNDADDALHKKIMAVLLAAEQDEHWLKAVTRWLEERPDDIWFFHQSSYFSQLREAIATEIP